MSEARKHFLQKFEHALKREIDPHLVPKIMEGSSVSDQEMNEAWLQETLDVCEISLGEEKVKKIMLHCGCHYNKERTLLLQHEYSRSKNIDKVMELLAAQVKETCQDHLHLPPPIIKQMKEANMGPVGVREGNKITITKAPKSSNIELYFKESDPQKKRALYCHCPHIAGFVYSEKKISKNFCYCGGGFYKQLWEEIIQRPVKITMLKSVLAGDDLCQFEIELPL